MPPVHMKRKHFEAWANELVTLLAELSSQDFGYEIGSNIVRPPVSSHPSIPAQLEPLYAVCDGVAMPDMHVGYFIDTSQRVSTAPAREEPVAIAGSTTLPITVFGSDGGGGRFALSVSDGAVFYLPVAGVRKRKFVEDETVRARRIAASVLEFLKDINADAQAFVRGDDAHVYVVDPRFAADAT